MSNTPPDESMEVTTTPAPQPTIQELQAQILDLQRQLLAALTKPTNTTPRELKGVAKPDIFDGTLSKAETFLSQLRLYFSAKREEVRDDHSKIVLALSYMKGGTAGPWARIKVKQLSTVDLAPPGAWEAFLEEFNLAFGDPDPKGTAIRKLAVLVQGSSTADEYVASFRELKDDTDYNDAALCSAFKKGLNSALVDKIYGLAHMPQTLDEWIHWATKLDRQWREREQEKKQWAAHKSAPKAAPAAVSKPLPAPPVQRTSVFKQPDVVPMEVDSQRKKAPVVCYRCRRPGHIAKACTSTLNISAMSYEELQKHFQEKAPEQDF
jgi:hypothetical protein